MNAMPDLGDDYFKSGLKLMEELESSDWSSDTLDSKQLRNYISSGDLNMFDSCPTKFYYTKIRKEGFLCDIGFHYYTVLKRAVTYVMKGKLDTEGVKLKDQWENLSLSGVWEEEPTKEDLEFYHGKIESLTNLFITQFADSVNPLFVEKKIHLPIPGNDSLFMHEYLDMMDDKGTIYLYKFPAKSPSLDKSTGIYNVSGNYVQTLAAYSALATNFKVPEGGHEVAAVYLVGSKTPKLVQQNFKITQVQIDALANKCKTIWKIITGDLYTTNRGSTFCKEGKGGCSHYTVCHTEN
jgi:hypothetical protein